MWKLRARSTIQILIINDGTHGEEKQWTLSFESLSSFFNHTGHFIYLYFEKSTLNWNFLKCQNENSCAIGCALGKRSKAINNVAVKMPITL